MIEGLVALMVLVVLALAALVGRRGRRGCVVDDQGLPIELQGAPVAAAEKTFRSQRRKLVARVDRAYRTAEGLQLLELKTRARDAVYMSDVIELSVQRTALEDETGERVSRDAWVVVQNSRTGARSPHKVRLLEVDEIVAMRARYDDLVRGKVARPNPSRLPAQCHQCAHRARCAAKFMDRG